MHHLRYLSYKYKLTLPINVCLENLHQYRLRRINLPAIDSTRKDSRNLPYRDLQCIDKVAMHNLELYVRIFMLSCYFMSCLLSDYHLRSLHNVY